MRYPGVRDMRYPGVRDMRYPSVQEEDQPGVSGQRVAWAFLGWLASGPFPFGALGLGRLARGAGPRPKVPTMPRRSNDSENLGDHNWRRLWETPSKKSQRR